MSPRFSNPRPNLYQSDEGYSVELLGRTGMRYIEGDRSMFVDSEVLATPGFKIATRLSVIKHWERPHENDAVSVEDRSRIVRNIRLALEWQGFQLQVDDEQSTF